MKHTLLLAILLFVSSTSAHALWIITGNHLLSDGRQVNLSGLEWMHWSETTGMSRTEVEGELGGSGKFDGWEFASRDQLGALFQSVWGGHEGWHESNALGGDWLVSNLGDVINAFNPNKNTGAHLFYGKSGECDANLSLSCPVMPCSMALIQVRVMVQMTTMKPWVHL